MIKWLERKGCLAVFPAGIESNFSFKEFKILDRKWRESASLIALRAKSTLLPVYFSGHNSLLFYLLALASPRLMIPLWPRELLSKRGKQFHVRIGQPIFPEEFSSDETPATLTRKIRNRVYDLGKTNL